MNMSFSFGFDGYREVQPLGWELTSTNTGDARSPLLQAYDESVTIQKTLPKKILNRF